MMGTHAHAAGPNFRRIRQVLVHRYRTDCTVLLLIRRRLLADITWVANMSLAMIASLARYLSPAIRYELPGYTVRSGVGTDVKE